jgi:hypothetical protein
MMDAADSGADAPEYDGSMLTQYALNQATAYCTRELGCCPGMDAGGYDLAGCQNLLAGLGWEGTLPQNYQVFNRPFVVMDQARAAGCLAAIAALPCGTQTPAQFAAVTSACEFVFTGTIPVGQSGCISSFECAPSAAIDAGGGAYCNKPADAGVGVCTALATAGQPCDTAINSADPTIPDYMCSYLASSNTGLYCDLIDPAGSPNYATCQPLLAAPMAPCTNATSMYFDDQACGAASGGPLCGDNGCGTSASYPYVGFCNTFIRDAGGGG